MNDNAHAVPSVTSSNKQSQVDVAVLGAGLGGLVAALAAARAGSRVVIIDASSTGGRAATDDVGGYKFNRGAHAFANAGKALAILTELGVDCSGRMPPLTQTRYLVDEEMGPVRPLRYLGVRGTAQFIGALARMTRQRRDEQFAAVTVKNYFDGCDVMPKVRLALDSAVRLATYAHCPDVVSVDLAMEVLATGSKGVRYVHGGWGSIVAQLRNLCTKQGVQFVAEKAKSVIELDRNVIVELHNGSSLEADHLICALGSAKASAHVLGHEARSWHLDAPVCATSNLDLGLSAIPKHRVVLGLNGPMYAVTHHPPANLAPAGGSVVHIMRYMHPHETLSVDEERRALNAAANAVGVRDDMRIEERYLHRMDVATALPTPYHGGMAGRPGVHVPDSQRMFVCGDWVGPGWLAEAVTQSAATAARAASQQGRIKSAA
jgi:phytoene dehydrogenase-like protein